MAFPLTGIKVLDMSRVLAGPFAGRMLSDLGADVVKLEPPEGDVTRHWGRKVGDVSGYFNQQNSGKRNVCVDLSDKQGVELVKSMVGVCDVRLTNTRYGGFTLCDTNCSQIEAKPTQCGDWRDLLEILFAV